MPTMQLRDIDAYYEVHGSGEALVLLHGLGSSCRDWERQTPALSRKFCTIAPDLRGFGRTGKPPGPYSMQRFADDLVTLLDLLHIEKAHLAGYSMGGAVALQFANDYAARVKSLILINSPACCVPSDWHATLELYLRLGAARCLGVRTAGRLVARRRFPGADQAELRASFAERYAENDKQAYLAALDALVDWSMDRWMHAIDVPTLVIARGGGAGPLEQRAALAAGMPNAVLQLVPEACQGPPYDRSGTFNSLMLDFLRSVH